jgi:hypothetical protein
MRGRSWFGRAGRHGANSGIAFIIQISQSSICNSYHTLQERLCRWLLVARDAVRSDVLFLTHDVIAHLLGTSERA